MEYDMVRTHSKETNSFNKEIENTQWFVYSRGFIDNMRKCLLNRSKVPPSELLNKTFSRYR